MIDETFEIEVIPQPSSGSLFAGLCAKLGKFVGSNLAAGHYDIHKEDLREENPKGSGGPSSPSCRCRFGNTLASRIGNFNSQRVHTIEHDVINFLCVCTCHLARSAGKRSLRALSVQKVASFNRLRGYTPRCRNPSCQNPKRKSNGPQESRVGTFYWQFLRIIFSPIVPSRAQN